MVQPKALSQIWKGQRLRSTGVMVDEAEQPKFPPKDLCQTLKDGDSYHYVVPVDQHGRGERASPLVSVWWSRSPKRRKIDKMGNKYTWRTEQHEELVLRQENGDNVGADVIMLTLGQAYALIEALCKAVERP
jgi:hypothetical protein